MDMPMSNRPMNRPMDAGMGAPSQQPMDQEQAAKDKIMEMAKALKQAADDMGIDLAPIFAAKTSTPKTVPPPPSAMP